MRQLLRLTAVIAALFTASVAVAAQQVASSGAGDTGGSMIATTATAIAAAPSPVLDGRDDDLAWRTAPAIDAFRQFHPAENGDPSFRTEARVVYDARNLYVMVRACDPHPDSILPLLSRRDVRTTPTRSRS